MENKFEIIDIDSVEYIGEFEDEYVYDIEMDSYTEHTFFANDILVHNSLYVCITQLTDNFSKDGKITEEAYTIAKEFEDYLNSNIKKWAISTLLTIDPRFEFKRESMCDNALFLEKKRYVLHVLDKEGIPCDSWKYTGVEVVRTTMPKAIKPYVKKIIQNMIMTKDEISTNKILGEAYDKFLEMDVSDISMVSGIKNLEKFVAGSDGFKTMKHMPCHVKSAYFYNLLLDELQIGNLYEKINSGDKLKYFYVETPNYYGIKTIGFKTKFPEEFKQYFKPDIHVMFEKDMYKCIERFYNAMQWVPRKPTDQLRCTLEELFC